jgi:PAS domain S-box-containing protein
LTISLPQKISGLSRDAQLPPVLRSVDWSGNPLGHPFNWPANLKTIVETLLNCSFPMYVAWGADLLMVPNAAYIKLFGLQNDRVCGQPMARVLSPIWADVGPLVDRVLAGESSFFEDFAADISGGGGERAWFTFSYSPVIDAASVGGLLCVVTETTGNVLMKKRQAFGLELLEELRGLSGSREITAAAATRLGRQLGASRVFYAAIDDEAGTFEVADDWTDGSLPSMAGARGLTDDFGPALIAEARQGRTSAIDDTQSDHRTRAGAQAHQALGLYALLNVPLVKAGRLIAALSIHRTAPCHWTRADISLAEDTTQHTWAALERTRAEDALKSQAVTEAARLRELFELSPGAIAVLSGREHVFEVVNRAFCEMVGRSDLIGKPMAQALPELAAQGFGKIVDGVLDTGMPFVAQGVPTRIQPDPKVPAREIHVDLLYQPRFGPDGKVIGLFLQANDVSGAYRARAALLQSEARFRAAVSAIGIMWTNNAAGEMTGAQPGWTAITGQSEAEYTGYGWSKRVHPEDAQPTLDGWNQAVRERRVFDFEHRLLTVQKEWRLFSVRAVPIFAASGQVAEWVGVHIDITDARRAEEALRETDRRKDEFLATLAHELRNPLAPIRTAAHVLASTTLASPKRAELQEIIVRQCRNMALLLDDLLDISRISSARLELRQSCVRLDAVLETAVEASRPLIDAKRHHLEVVLPAAPALVNADPLRLAQVVTNLLNNAAKYTDAGGHIVLSLAQDETAIRISVQDDGIGIDTASLPHIFNMFSQVKSAIDRSEGGLGIGLSLAKGIIGLHGGTIEAESAGAGSGTRVTVLLPLDILRSEAPSKGVPGAAPRADAAPLGVLVVDDNVDAAETFATVLRLAGHDVTTAHSGIEALGMASGRAFDAALLDIGMPGMNGYELARQLRQQPGGEKVVLIALTGWGQESDKMDARSAGFDHHFTKPIDPIEISDVLARKRGA